MKPAMSSVLREQLRPAIALFIAFTLITGILYPLVVTGISQLLFPYQANGSLIERDGQIIGSDLIAQSFSNPEYFWSRPSAVNYDAAASGGSNLGPGSKVLLGDIESRSELLQADASNLVPVDLVTASASGLDPHITPASAYYQAARVAAARGIPIETVEQLIADHIEEPSFGILGETRVNVLGLNLALDAMER
jgi:K+-transporting ATPase ATPase C chain